ELDQRELFDGKRPDLLVRLEADFPFRTVVADETSQKPREIGRDRIAAGRVRVDEAGDLVVRKEDMVVPDVAQARLQCNVRSEPGCERTGVLGSRARKSVENLAAERGKHIGRRCRQSQLDETNRRLIPAGDFAGALGQPWRKARWRPEEPGRFGIARGEALG